MNAVTREFLNRIFDCNRTSWWCELQSETPQKGNAAARCLQTTLEEELEEYPAYRHSERMLYFFSTHHRSTIDGRYMTVGVEEKVNPLSLDETLIDGAIHRGVVWVVGNPYGLSAVEAVSIFVLPRGSRPMLSEVTDLYVPILIAAHKVGVHVVFVDGCTGDHWQVEDFYDGRTLPSWLSTSSAPAIWDQQLEVADEKRDHALAVLGQLPSISEMPGELLPMPGSGCSTRKARFKSLVQGDLKIAVVENGDQWRVIEHGLLLRSFGFDAVKSIYNREMHKNDSDRHRPLRLAGRGVERRVAEMMQKRFAVVLDWQTDS